MSALIKKIACCGVKMLGSSQSPCKHQVGGPRQYFPMAWNTGSSSLEPSKIAAALGIMDRVGEALAGCLIDVTESSSADPAVNGWC